MAWDTGSSSWSGERTRQLHPRCSLACGEQPIGNRRIQNESAARALEVNPKVLHRWRREFRGGPRNAFPGNGKSAGLKAGSRSWRGKSASRPGDLFAPPFSLLPLPCGSWRAAIDIPLLSRISRRQLEQERRRMECVWVDPARVSGNGEPSRIHTDPVIQFRDDTPLADIARDCDATARLARSPTLLHEAETFHWAGGDCLVFPQGIVPFD